VIAHRWWADALASLGGKLEMVRREWMPEHDSVESIVIHELSENTKAKAIRVHLGNAREVVSRPSHPQYRVSFHGQEVDDCAGEVSPRE
jgi:hypothetical protein